MLLLVTLRLLLNLSFDEDLRAKMVARNLVPRVVELMKTRTFSTSRWRFCTTSPWKTPSSPCSRTPTPRPWFSIFSSRWKTCTPRRSHRARREPHPRRSPRGAICETSRGRTRRGFDLSSVALRLRDPLAFKVIRNLSERGDRVKAKFAPYLPEMIRALKEEEPGSDLMVEVLGTLGNLHCPSLDMTRRAWNTAY